jgi:hypothetical protein
MAKNQTQEGTNIKKVGSKEEKFTTYGICVLLIGLFRFQLLWLCSNLYSCVKEHVLFQNMNEN